MDGWPAGVILRVMSKTRRRYIRFTCHLNDELWESKLDFLTLLMILLLPQHPRIIPSSVYPPDIVSPFRTAAAAASSVPL